MHRHHARISAAFLLLSSFMLAFTGCGSVSGNNPTPTPTPVANPSPTPIASPTPTPVASNAQIVFESSFICTPGNKNCADGNSTDGVYAYRVNPANGEVTDVAGSPFFTGSNSEFVAALPSGKFVYAVDSVVQTGGIQMINHGTNDIITFQPDSVTGALSKIASTPLPAQPQDVILHPSGKFLYISLFGRGLLGFAIDQNSGALTPVSIPAALSNTNVASMVIDPAGKFLYIRGNQLAGFHINSADGTLTPVAGSPITFPNTFFLSSLAIHPSGKFLYGTSVAISDQIKCLGFSADPATGALAQLPDPVIINGATLPVTVFSFSQDGAFAYATGPEANGVTMLSVNTSTGLLTAGNFTASPQAVEAGGVTDSSGQFLYTNGQGITGFQIQGDGTALLLPGFPHGKGFSPGPHSIAIAPLP